MKEIETWVQAIGQYDNQDFEEALRTFDVIADTSKIIFNCGVIHATIGEHNKAVECFQRAIKRDNYLAVAYFQQGVSNFLVGDFEEALANFNDALLYLRGNRYINYEQLGLKYRLCSCEVLFNRGLCYIYLQQKEAGMGDLFYAAKEKVKSDHDVIDEAIREEAEGYTVFSIPVGVIYRPNNAKVKNLKAKDYLGKARLIATSDQSNAFIGSVSAEAKAHAAAINRDVDDRPLESISFGASNLVKPGLHSRSRQQSEPPVNRNMFPPTPPPDHDPIRPAFPTASSSPPSNFPAMAAQTNSLHHQPSPSKPPRPEPLNLESLQNHSRPRIGTTRTASEPRGPPRSNHDSREHGSRQRLFMETTPLRPHSNGAEADVDEYPEELYQLYPHNRQKHSSHRSSSDNSQRRPSSRRRNSGRSRSRQRRQHYSIEEEPSEDPGTASAGSSLDEFEILNNAGGGLSRPPPPRARSSSRRGASRSRRPLEIRNMRVKVHNGDDTRYIMITPDVAFERFVEKVREKFGMKGTFKLKVKDEGDLITMGDRDDWDMAIGAVRKEARIEGADMGKMEVWVQEVT
ncbi:hypothetical protein MMC28_000259 [Mycoblastus sanguinarius]|nr:hypothetical protein [Mycoblastus sanguinarius]